MFQNELWLTNAIAKGRQDETGTIKGTGCLGFCGTCWENLVGCGLENAALCTKRHDKNLIYMRIYQKDLKIYFLPNRNRKENSNIGVLNYWRSQMKLSLALVFVVSISAQVNNEGILSQSLPYI